MSRSLEPSSASQVLRSFSLCVGLLALLSLAWFTRHLVFASLIGIGLGVLASPVMTVLQSRFRIPRGLSALLLVVGVLAGFIAVGWAIGGLLSEQFDSLMEKAPQLASSLREQAEALFRRVPWFERQLRRIEFGGAAQSAFTTVFQGLRIGVASVVGLIVVLTIGFYTATNARAYFNGVLTLFPAYLRPRAAETLESSGKVLRRWFKAQLTIMAISGGATTLALWVLGIDYWLLLGTITTLLGIIPFVGAFLSGAATVLVTLGTEPEKVWWVLGLYLAIQEIESDVTIPVIMKGAIQLPEAHLLILMLVMGSVFGFLGVFIAPPLLAVGRHVYVKTYVSAMNSKVRPELRDAA